MDPIQTVPPATTILTLAQTKSILYLDGTSQDTELTELMAEVTDVIERMTNYCWVEQTWQEYYPCFASSLMLQYSPVTSTTVTYYDSSNVSRSVSSSNYHIVNLPLARVSFAWDYVFPDTYDRDDAVIVTNVCGGTIPYAVRRAAKHLTAYLWENRGDTDCGFPDGLMRLINTCRMGHSIG